MENQAQNTKDIINVVSNANVFQRIKSKNKKVIILIGAFSIVVFIFSFLFKTTLVLDANTKLPISRAIVKTQTSGWNGCSDHSTKQTILGITTSWALFRCQLTVEKDGYHINGANKIATLPGFLGFRIVFLNKINNPTPLIKFKRIFSLNDGMDVLSYLKDLDAQIPPENMRGNVDNDFIFVQVGSIGQSGFNESGKIGDPIYKIQFLGEGGIQEVSKDDTEGYAGSLYYDLENMLIAPKYGYKKEMTIRSGKAYVARLKDGSHYMVFYMLGGGMTGYIQPLESRNFEFVGLTRNDFLSENENSSNYDLKLKYLDLKKELTGEHTLAYAMQYKNYTSFYIKEFMGKYYFSFAFNDDRYPNTGKIIPITSLKNRKVVIRLPPFEVFSAQFNPNGTQIPVDVFMDNTYLNPFLIKF